MKMPADPAWGRTKLQRALGDTQSKNPNSLKMSRNESFHNYGVRNIANGEFSGPRPSYGKYQVSEQAQDILNKQLRSYNK